MIISGCFSGGGYYTNIPPNGSTFVWPPVFCKTTDTNWEGGTQIGLIELQDNSLKVYPNPINTEPLTIITLSNTKYRLMDVFGTEISGSVFENKTELHINSLPNGIYFLELEINGNKVIKKILKSN